MLKLIAYCKYNVIGNYFYLISSVSLQTVTQVYSIYSLLYHSVTKQAYSSHELDDCLVYFNRVLP